jgi:hypothetical protein
VGEDHNRDVAVGVEAADDGTGSSYEHALDDRTEPLYCSAGEQQPDLDVTAPERTLACPVRARSGL